tara:strand:+ start:1048 stop:1296 length:249 start_codon:yes stop_codon:yes gene_type:complete
MIETQSLKRLLISLITCSDSQFKIDAGTEVIQIKYLHVRSGEERIYSIKVEVQGKLSKIEYVEYRISLLNKALCEIHLDMMF